VVYGQTWPEEMDDACHRYSTLAFELEERVRALAEVIKQHEGQGLNDRWDQA
jgi:hypothetical protein